MAEQDGRTYQSIPVIAFYTRDLEYLYHYTEFPAIYQKERLAKAMQAVGADETREQAWERFMRERGSHAAVAVLQAVGLRRRRRDALGPVRADAGGRRMSGPSPDRFLE